MESRKLYSSGGGCQRRCLMGGGWEKCVRGIGCNRAGRKVAMSEKEVNTPDLPVEGVMEPVESPE